MKNKNISRLARIMHSKKPLNKKPVAAALIRIGFSLNRLALESGLSIEKIRAYRKTPEGRTGLTKALTGFALTVIRIHEAYPDDNIHYAVGVQGLKPNKKPVAAALIRIGFFKPRSFFQYRIH
jgi:hypothetical protein